MKTPSPPIEDDNSDPIVNELSPSDESNSKTKMMRAKKKAKVNCSTLNKKIELMETILAKYIYKFDASTQQIKQLKAKIHQVLSKFRNLDS